MTTDKSNDYRFICYLTGNSLPPVSAALLQATYQRLFPTLAVQFPLAVNQGQAVSDIPNLLQIGSVQLVILSVPRPLPPEVWKRAVELDRVWPEAQQVLPSQTSHVIVSTLEATSQSTALVAASAVTVASVVLAECVNAKAAIWTAADTVMSYQHLLEMAKSLDQRHLPMMLWMSLTWLDVPVPASAQRQLVALTTGLAPFVGREIEFMPSPLPPATIAQRVMGTAQYLMTNGLVLKDGDTLGVTEAEKIRVRFAARGQRPGVPVVQLQKGQG